MSPPKTVQNTKKSSSQFFQCEKCLANIVSKDVELHTKDCPPDTKKIDYGYVKDGILYNKLDMKTNQDVTGVAETETEFMVFLSQVSIQLCSLSIGEWAILTTVEGNKPPIARIVWPTSEKNVTSVLMTKNGLDMGFPLGTAVSVSKFDSCFPVAKKITIVLLNGPKNLDFSKELSNRLLKKHIGKLIACGNKLSMLFYGKMLKFEVKSIEKGIIHNLEHELEMLGINEVFYEIKENTQCEVFSKEDHFENNLKNKKTLSKLGGLHTEIEEIKSLIDTVLTECEKLHFNKCHSVLLYGNSGTGKTYLAEAIANEYGGNIFPISVSELYTKGGGNVENIINDIFREAIGSSPSIIIIDNIDILCPLWTNRLNDTDKRISSTLLKNLEMLHVQMSSPVFVIATTNKPESIDPMFRRCGILDREIEIPTPSPKARKDILNKLLENVVYNIDDANLTQIALNCHGFVGADLVSLCSGATLNANRRHGDCIKMQDFNSALKLVRPSAMRDVQIEIPNVKWTDIGGQEDLKLILKQAVEWPLKHPESFTRLGITPPKGVLMFGPPGCSKTMIAKALATESGLNFLSIKGPELFSKWVGESERGVREVFRKARQVSPSIVFFDEIDALGGERTAGSNASVQERVLAQLLTELDGVSPLGDVTVLAATNRPDRIDKALLRPGRLDRIVYVPLPNDKTRMDILKIKLSKMPVMHVAIEELVKSTEGYSGAEMNAVCHEAAMVALEENLEVQHVEHRHFQKALKLITPRTPPSLLKLYDDYLKI